MCMVSMLMLILLPLQMTQRPNQTDTAIWLCHKMGDQFIPSIDMHGVEPMILHLAELCKHMRMYTTVPTFMLNPILLESSIHFLLLLP